MEGGPKFASTAGPKFSSRASHALLRAAGASSHGLATRNYALVQLMLQAGLRVGEVAALQVGDITMNDRSGSVRIRQGKGLKAREVPLNATARRALKQHLEHRQAPGKTAALFVSSRDTAMPVRTIQSVIASLARRARLKRVMLPWGGGTWLAGLAFGGRWNAGEAMMQEANPVQWERMARLYKACPEDSTTELCEAAEAVRTISPSRPLPHENRTRQQTP